LERVNVLRYRSAAKHYSISAKKKMHTEQTCIREAKALLKHMQEAQLYAYLQVVYEEGMSLCI
jgi:hypothetical protein